MACSALVRVFFGISSVFVRYFIGKAPANTEEDTNKTQRRPGKVPCGP